MHIERTLWFVVRTAPGAQQPQREYAVEPTKSAMDGKTRGKGYRIVPSLNPNLSAVERALSDAGFDHYMPCCKKVVQDRKKARAWTTRRFALLPGYIFIRDSLTGALHGKEVSISDVAGVEGVVGCGGKPIAVDLLDILNLRTIEARHEWEADQEVARNISRDKSEAAKTATKAMASAKRTYTPGTRVRVMWGAAVGRDAIVQGWGDDGRLKALVEGLDAAETIEVPHANVSRLTSRYGVEQMVA